MEDMMTSPFDAIRRIDELGREYWDAHELAKILGYTQYQNFKKALRKAEASIRESWLNTSFRRFVE